MRTSPIQLIFCVETTSKAATDRQYINALLNRFYQVGENKISYVYMQGKHNYQDQRVIKDIQKLKKDYALTGQGQSFVIYVFDKDMNAQNPQDNAFVKEITRYCKEREYAYVWFVRTIEEVLWGSKVRKQEKRKKAEQFIARHRINEVKEGALRAHQNVNAQGKSNILTVLDRFKEIQAS